MIYLFEPVSKLWEVWRGKLGRAFVTFDLTDPLVTSETKPRIRVDVAQTSFFEGKQFRTFKELSLTPSTPFYFKMVRPINCVLLGLELDCDNGHMRLDVYRDSTESGTWNVALPIIAQDEMTERPAPVYSSQVQILTGGTFSGGTLRDFKVLNGTSVPSKASTIGGGTQDERGVAAGTGYYKISTTDAGPITGKLLFRWEERP